jgi:hypothetical protein
MNRIHEALKKAEEERAASQPAPLETSPLGEMGTTLPPGMPALGSSAAAAPQFATQFSFETLMARCTPAQWHPQARTMLFFNQQEHASGMEEFRTLRSRLYQLR